MRVAVIGAGGTGCYFGGLLARAGEEVTFIARGATRDALRDRGVLIKSKQLGEVRLPVRATDNPAAVGPVDLILLCVKTYDTASAIPSLPPLVGPQTLLLSVQNGIGNEEQVAAAIGREHVLGCTAAVSAVVESPGGIRLDVEPALLRFGELAGGTSARTDALLATLQRAAFTTLLDDAMPVRLWDKLMAICVLSGVCTLTRQPVGIVRHFPATRAFAIEVMREILAVAQAHSIALTQQHLDAVIATLDQISPQAYGSMYHDLVAGRRLELESLNGAVVRLGREAGVPTPCNAAIYAALQPYLDGAPVLP